MVDNHYGGHHKGVPKCSLVDVRALIDADAWEFATKRCRERALELGLASRQVREVLLLLEPGDFSKFFGPCHSEFGTTDADVYLLWCDLSTLQRCAPGQGERIYVKVGIDSDPNLGDCCLVISFHRALR